MKADKLNIVIVEDDAIIALELQMHLEEAGHTVLQVFHSGELVANYVKTHDVDLVFLDIQIEGDMDGIAVGTELHAWGGVPFIYLTAFADRATIERAKHTKPCAYIVKPYKADDLFAAIEIGLFNYGGRLKVLDGALLNRIATSELTSREVEVTLDILQGLSNAQIAERQYLSLNTIKWHIQNIYSKFGVKNRATLSRLVHEH